MSSDTTTTTEQPGPGDPDRAPSGPPDLPEESPSLRPGPAGGLGTADPEKPVEGGTDRRRWPAVREQLRSAGPALLRTSRRRPLLMSLAGFAAFRLLDLLIVTVVVRRQHPPRPLYAEVGRALSSWDGRWYLQIIRHGYDWRLQTGPHGILRQNALAFFPAYPYLVRWTHHLTRINEVKLGVAISLLTAGAAAVGLTALLRPLVGPGTALGSSLVWSALPASAVYGFVYTEGLYAAELVGLLLLLQRRRYLTMVPLLLVMGLTRGAGIPVAAVLAVHLAQRVRSWSQDRHTHRPQPPRTLAGPALAFAASVAGALLWPGFIALRTGEWNAYLKIQQAWVQTADRAVVPWLTAVDRLGMPLRQGVLLDVITLVFLGCLVLAVWGMTTRLPLELRVYLPMYLVFVLVLLPPYPSFFRYLLPALTLPVLLVLGVRSWPGRFGLVAMLVVTQYWWLGLILTQTAAFHVPA
ncbi:MAG TPA: hypothetical protein VFP72_08565 [Kineosporiaceae bacterium]|nr:hypothetical protein [Kineosporiaceae bacterium]